MFLTRLHGRAAVPGHNAGGRMLLQGLSVACCVASHVVSRLRNSCLSGSGDMGSWDRALFVRFGISRTVLAKGGGFRGKMQDCGWCLVTTNSLRRSGPTFQQHGASPIWLPDNEAHTWHGEAGVGDSRAAAESWLTCTNSAPPDGRQLNRHPPIEGCRWNTSSQTWKVC